MNRFRTALLTLGLVFGTGIALAPAAPALPIGPGVTIPPVVSIPPPTTTTTTRPRINPCAVRDCTTIPPVLVDPCIQLPGGCPTTTTTSTTSTTSTTTTTSPTHDDPDPTVVVDDVVEVRPNFAG